MLAATYDRYGTDHLEVADVGDPEPAAGEVRIRVRAASVNPRDWHLLLGSPYVMRVQFGVRGPRDHGLGSDVAGVVDAVGPGVTAFAPGDEVLADVVTGGFAERVCVAADLVAAKPDGLSFEDAAAIPLAGVTALQGLERAGVGPGQHVLVLGASGGVGSFAVQLATHLGAEVTGVCSTGNLELVRSLGADHVVDYTREDLLATGRRYEVVFQLGGRDSARRLRRLLTPDGTILLSSGEARGHVVGPLWRIVGGALLKPFVRQEIVVFEAAADGDDLRTVVDLVAAGAVTPVVDRTWPLAEVADAVRHVEAGHTRGKVVITV